MHQPTFRSLLVVALAIPLTAAANMGVPMVAVFLPPLWLSLFPVIAIEAWIVAKKLNLPPLRSLAGVAFGNTLSTLIGTPFMWAVLATIQGVFAGGAYGLTTLGQKVFAVTVQAPWLIPYEQDLGWMIPLALLVLAVPAYMFSVLIEWRALLPFLDAGKRQQALRVVFIANAASYLLLALLFLGTFHFGEQLSPLFAMFDGVTNWFVEGVFMAARLFHGAN